MSLDRDVATLWQAVSNQGKGLSNLEPVVARIREAVNAQANGLRSAEARITALERALSMQSAGVRVDPRARTGQLMRSMPLRALPSQFPAKGFVEGGLVERDDPSADADYDDDEDEAEAG